MIGLTSPRAQDFNGRLDEEVAPFADQGTVLSDFLRDDAAYGLEAESLPGELAEDIGGARAQPMFGPTPVKDIRFLMDNLEFQNLFGNSGIRTFGSIAAQYVAAVSA